MLSCKKVTELLSEGIDRPLPWYKQVELRFHTLMCKLCKRYSQQIGVVDQAMSEYKNQCAHDSHHENLCLSAAKREEMKDAMVKNSENI